MVANVLPVSRYRGVSWCAERGMWLASLVHAGREICIGWYIAEEFAAAAHDLAAGQLFGCEAQINGVRIRGARVRLPDGATEREPVRRKPRHAVITLRLSFDDHRGLQSAAEQAGVSLNALCLARLCGLDLPPPETHDPAPCAVSEFSEALN